jgi:hypothetical protein
VILLSSTSSVLELVTGGSCNVDVSISYVDATDVVITPAADQDQTITVAGTFIICAAPEPANQRNIKYVSIANVGVTPVAIAVQHTDGFIVSVMIATFNLLPGYTLMYEDGRGWYLKFQGADVVIVAGSAVSGIALAAGTQTASSGTVVFSNSNNVTFGMSGSSVVTASAEINVSAGTTSQNLSALTFSNSNNISFGLNGSVLTGSINVSAANINISAGTTSNEASAYTFSNSNNVSFGLNASTITASAQINVSAGTTSQNLSALTFSNTNNISFGLNGSVLTGSINVSAANINISAGTTSNEASAYTFSNSNNVQFGLNASTITAFAPINLSAGTTSNLSSAFTFGNGNGVSFGLNAGTLTASIVQVGTISVFSQDADFVTNFPLSQAALSFQKLSMAMNLSATQLALIAAFNGMSNQAETITISHAVYTLSAGTASLASSGSRVISWTTGSATTASSVYGGASGTRYRTIAVSYAMTPGDYIFGFWASTANGATVNLFGRAAMNLVGTFDGVETATFLNGLSASTVAALPASFAATNTNYVRTGFSALRQPGAILFGTN